MRREREGTEREKEIKKTKEKEKRERERERESMKDKRSVCNPPLNYIYQYAHTISFWYARIIIIDQYNFDYT